VSSYGPPKKTPPPMPTPGHPVTRRKPYVYVTWVAKLLGGNECMWSAWFKAHHKYAKFERDAEQLKEWNREHTALMAIRRTELEAEGWTVYTEDANSFTLEGQTADVAGKPDIVATLDDQVLIVDGKTGRRRDSDQWQVLLYLYALPLVRREMATGKELVGEVFYKAGRPVLVEPPSAEQVEQMVRLIKVIAAAAPPARTPSQFECSRCDISIADCPQRYTSEQRHTAKVSGF
jgi:CRISPR/Cas system-associated exonuclease Cas4 (RecB family)